MSFDALARVGVLIISRPDNPTFGLPDIWECGQDTAIASIAANGAPSLNSDNPAFHIIDGMSRVPTHIIDGIADYALCFAGLLNQKLSKTAPILAEFDFTADSICKWVVSYIGRLCFAETHGYEKPTDQPQFLKGAYAKLHDATAIILCIDDRAKRFHLCALKDAEKVIDCGSYKNELALWEAAGAANRAANAALYVDQARRDLFRACAEDKYKTHILDDWITSKVAFMAEATRANWAQNTRNSYRPNDGEFRDYLTGLVEAGGTDAERARAVLDSL